MSLDHALLVSLLERPSSGYELARRFDKSIGYFWHATHQQIYKVLARMELAGWIESEVQRGESAPDRKVFSVTGSGRETLSLWVSDTSEMETLRSALLVKLRATAFNNPALLSAELQLHRNQHADMLASYRVIEARDFARTLAPQQALQYHVLKFGLAYEQTWINWCDEALALVATLSQSKTTEET
jgi:DNA-binding PadR family transcriptional regulator